MPLNSPYNSSIFEICSIPGGKYLMIIFCEGCVGLWDIEASYDSALTDEGGRRVVGKLVTVYETLLFPTMNNFHVEEDVLLVAVAGPMRLEE